MKGVSAIIVAILLLMISVSMVSLGYVFLTGTLSDTTQTVEDLSDQSSVALLSKMKIDSVSNRQVYLRNNGKVDVSQFSVYINDVLDAGAVPDKDKLSPGDISNITLSSAPNVGDIIKVTSAEGSFAIASVKAPPGVTCPDGICDDSINENCPADASWCPDGLCREPTCLSGCGWVFVLNGENDESCNDDSDCVGGDCACDGAGYCVSFSCGNGACDVLGGECSSCPGDCTFGECCGNSICDSAFEDYISCPGDCITGCGDSFCDFPIGECDSCPGDCSVGECCGTDTACNAAVGETAGNCPSDCSGCGDSFCDFPTGECDSCPSDCSVGECCGTDTACNNAVGETAGNCPSDCSAGGVVGFWNFDGNTLDSSSFGNDGTRRPSCPDCPQFVSGISNNGLDFDGSNDFVSVSDDSSLDITDEMSVLAWLKVDGYSSTGYLISKNYDYGVEMSYAIYIYNDGHVIVYLDHTSWDTGYVMPIGGWVHLGVVWDGINAYLYVNGSYVNSASRNFALTPNDYRLCIGCRNAGGSSTSFFIDGIIDELKIYDIALDAAEVNQDYLDGIPSATDCGMCEVNMCQAACGGPCSFGEGDCEAGVGECQSGLICGQNIGNDFGCSDSSIDVCVECTSDTDCGSDVCCLDTEIAATQCLSADKYKCFTPSSAIFSDGFESGDFSAWTGRSQNGASISVVTSPVHSGTYSAKTSGLNTNGEYAFSYKGIADQSTVFARTYFQISALPPAHGNSAIILRLRGSGQLIFDGRIYNSGGLMYIQGGKWLSGAWTGYVSSSSISITPNTWHSLELKAVIGTSGQYVVYYDGTQVATITGDNTGRGNVNMVDAGVSWLIDSWSTSVTVDDIVVSNTYIGT